MLHYLKKHKIKTTFLILLIILLFYYSSGYIFVYNNDAYVNADVIQITSTVSGRITQINVKDNQYVTKGQPLFTINNQPFVLAVRQAQTTVAQKEAQLAALPSALQEMQADIENKKAALEDASYRWKQAQILYRDHNISETQYHHAMAQYKMAQSDYVKAQKTYANEQSQEKVLKATLKNAQTELAQAQYQLSQTTVYAPSDGFINNLQTHSGDYAIKGQALFGFVKDNSWYVTANIKETNLPLVALGKTVWVYLSSRPWHLYRGKIIGVTKGVARNNTSLQSALPYVEPVTSWIRYPYRVPVQIQLVNFPKEVSLQRGIDAKVVIF